MFQKVNIHTFIELGVLVDGAEKELLLIWLQSMMAQD
jgi:hypothetical protein